MSSDDDLRAELGAAIGSRTGNTITATVDALLPVVRAKLAEAWRVGWWVGLDDVRLDRKPTPNPWREDSRG